MRKNPTVSKVLIMRHLFRQWRLVRFLNKTIKQSDNANPSTWEFDPSALVQDVANAYAKKRKILPIDAERLIRSCIDSGFITKRVDIEGTYIFVSHGKGPKFLAIR